MTTKVIFSLLLSFSLMSCGLQSKGKHTYEPQASSIEKSMRYLSSDELEGRETGSQGIEKAAVFIENIFREANLKPYYKTYRDSFDYKDKVGYNLIAFKEGSDEKLKNEVIILGAHYDHIGIITPEAGDSIANGANDDASGTTAVLELAKTFAQIETKRSILFTLFSAEEKGLVGSKHLAERLEKEGVHPYVMLNFEMIAVPMKNTAYLAYLTGYQVSNFADVFNSFSSEDVLGYWEDENKYQVFKRSDNYAFYKALDIPAHTLSSFNFENFDHYHKVGDEMDLVDVDFMERLIRATVPGIQGLANTETQNIQLNTH